MALSEINNDTGIVLEEGQQYLVAELTDGTQLMVELISNNEYSNDQMSTRAAQRVLKTNTFRFTAKNILGITYTAFEIKMEVDFSLDGANSRIYTSAYSVQNEDKSWKVSNVAATNLAQTMHSYSFDIAHVSEWLYGSFSASCMMGNVTFNSSMD